MNDNTTAFGALSLLALGIASGFAAIAVRSGSAHHWDSATAAVVAVVMLGWPGQVFARAWPKAVAEGSKS